MFKGLYTALITPFHAANIDYDTFESFIEWQLECGVDGLVICGTTGESATLSPQEKRDLSAFAIDRVAGRVPVILGTGTNSTKTSIEASIQARELGADGALVVTPYYNKPSQEGLFQHFSSIAKESGIPLVLYDIPGRCVVEIELETILRLSEVEGIVAIKDAANRQEKTILIQERTPENFCLLTGEDKQTHSTMEIGGQGVISASANVIPIEMKKIVTAGLAANFASSKLAQEEANPAIDALFLESNPAPAKAVLKMQGRIPSEALRLPLVNVTDTTREKLKAQFNC